MHISVTSGQHNGISGHLVESLNNWYSLIIMIKGGQIMRRLDMLKTRQVLRLRYELGLSLREIGQACSCGKTTVSEILMRAKRAEIVWPIDFSDKQLMSRLYPPAETKTSAHKPDMEYIFQEMKKKSKRGSGLAMTYFPAIIVCC